MQFAYPHAYEQVVCCLASDTCMFSLCSAIIFFVAFVLDAAFSLSVCGFLVMHARMVAQVCSVPVWLLQLSDAQGI